MSTWHVWGDFVHTMPRQIGNACVVEASADDARKTANDRGFDFERRVRNGFEPWAATFISEEDDEGQEFAFANEPTVRGWTSVSSGTRG